VLKDRTKTETASPSFFSQRKNAALPPPQTRPSHGLEQFFSSIQGEENLSILDFAGASQANVSFITALGHRIYSNDVVHTMEEVFGADGNFAANQADPKRAALFLGEAVSFTENSFDGALLWDTLQFLAPPLLEQTVEQLFRALRPGAFLLAFFHAEEKMNSAPLYSYRILSNKTMSLTPRGTSWPTQYFNNRSLEKLFQKYQSVKFFLTRDHLREVIVRR
jgi:methyltransferase family protein